MTYPATAPGSLQAPVSDPLGGLPRPQGNPDAVQSAGRSYQAAGQELDAISGRLNQSASGVVGQAWIGRAGASCEATTSGLAKAYVKAGQDAQEAAGALQTCAQKWRSALQEYDRARRLADQAVEEETGHRERAEREAQAASGSGDEGRASAVRSSAATYQSQSRGQAQRIASAAIGDFDAATQQACGKLDSIGTSIKNWMTALSVAGGGVLSALEKVHQYGAERWVKNVPGYFKSNGEWVPRQGYVPDREMRSKWGRRAKGLKYGGYALATGTASVSQWAADQRKHPNMETDERVGRAAANGATAGLGSAVVGGLAGSAASAGSAALMGATMGSVVPGVGTAVGLVVGGAVGYFTGEAISKHNDAIVNAAGDAADAAGDAVGSATEAVGDAAGSAVDAVGDAVDTVTPW